MVSIHTHIYMHTLTLLYTQTHVYVFQVDLIFGSLSKLNLNKFVIAEFSIYMCVIANKPP